MVVKLRNIGNSLGLILPKEVLTRLALREGDTLSVTETEAGLVLSPFDPDFDAAMKAAERTISRYRDTLRRLAE